MYSVQFSLFMIPYINILVCILPEQVNKERTVHSAQSCPTLCDPWTATCQDTLSITSSWSLLTHVHQVGGAFQLSHPVVPFSSCLQSFPASGTFLIGQLSASCSQSVGVSLSASVLPTNIQDWFPDWFDLLAVQGALKSLLQEDSSKASIIQHLAFFIVQLSHPYITTGKVIALSIWTFDSK